MSPAGQHPAEETGWKAQLSHQPGSHTPDTGSGPPLPGPAEEWGSCTGQGHDPGEGDAHDGVVLPKAKVAHGLADHDVSLDSQDHQRPEGNFTCTRERDRKGHRGFEQQEKKNTLMAA